MCIFSFENLEKRVEMHYIFLEKCVILKPRTSKDGDFLETQGYPRFNRLEKQHRPQTFSSQRC